MSPFPAAMDCRRSGPAVPTDRGFGRRSANTAARHGRDSRPLSRRRKSQKSPWRTQWRPSTNHHLLLNERTSRKSAASLRKASESPIPSFGGAFGSGPRRSRGRCWRNSASWSGPSISSARPETKNEVRSTRSDPPASLSLSHVADIASLNLIGQDLLSNEPVERHPWPVDPEPAQGRHIIVHRPAVAVGVAQVAQDIGHACRGPAVNEEQTGSGSEPVPRQSAAGGPGANC